jgi:hypothetical protein
MIYPKWEHFPHDADMECVAAKRPHSIVGIARGTTYEDETGGWKRVYLIDGRESALARQRIGKPAVPRNGIAL